MTKTTSEPFGLMIAGPTQCAGELEVHSPFSGETLANVARCGESHVEPALELAQATFNDKSGWLTVSKRIEILRLAATAYGQPCRG